MTIHDDVTEETGTARPLLLESSSGGVPPQTETQRLARERTYNLYSAAIGACLARGDTARARALSDEEARLPFLEHEEIDRLNRELPDTVAVLRRVPLRTPSGAVPGDPSRDPGRAGRDDLFDLFLRPRLTGPARERPRVLLLGGQPGAGKTTLQRLLLPVLPEGTVGYDGDDLLRLAPDYEWVMSSDDRTASLFLGRQVAWMHHRALEYVRRERVDVVCSHRLGRSDWATAWTEGFREAGYRVEVAFVATHSTNSVSSLEERYERARRDQGFGRWVPPVDHDRAYLGVPNTLEFLETHRLVDTVYVLSRLGEVLYANHLTGTGDWRTEPFGRIALEAERGRRDLWHRPAVADQG
ncbi:zeta toxin family protein [Nocardiopsis sp. CNT312]|uniref:zeta toxin family protein n=1 Tax=Nocardiopsis sp. CNT312 TaxID=1137268 RepID=UPI0004920738|nr:zeta toxin family protein [Nocardiopsis sp. CNT312]